MSARTVATPDTLNGIMEFDHVIRVHGDGTVTAEPDVYAPCLDDGELDNSADWTMMGGYSGQYGYRGPVMHASEYIGGGMARDILDNAGVYVAIVANYTCTDCEPDEDCDCDTADGWAVARLDSPAECKGICCHDPECTGCEHDCPWRGNPMGAPFCSFCDDHSEHAHALEGDDA